MIRSSTAVINAYDFAPFDTIVDVGGGQGSFIAAVLEANPGLNGILFDLPQVVQGAKGYIEAAGLAGRCKVTAGDFFESLPGGGDLYMLKKIIVNWDDERAIAILKNCHRAMAENGKLLVVEVGMFAPRNAPSFSKLFDLHMLVMVGGRGRAKAVPSGPGGTGKRAQRRATRIIVDKTMTMDALPPADAVDPVAHPRSQVPTRRIRTSV